MSVRVRRSRVVAPGDLVEELEAQLAAKPPSSPRFGRRARNLAMRGTLLVQAFVLAFALIAPLGTIASQPSDPPDQAGVGATADPTATPDPTAEPTAEPTAAPTETPTEAPAPTEAPTEAPAPTADPTAAPTEAPTEAPTAAPTDAPTAAPTEAPTAAPTEAPAPTAEPTPTEAPTAAPADPTPTPAAVEPVAMPTAALPVYAPSGPPTIASDKADYAPGETVTLTGTNWAAGESVRIVVNDTYGSSWKRDVTVTASDVGVVIDVFSLPTWFVSNYNVVATGPVSGTATTTFTDSSVGSYDQCSNDDGDGYATPDLGCRWTSGNLQRNNSRYAEGEATVQRLWLEALVPGSVHTLTLKYGTTKQGKHAYDYLTTWDYSENWITDADLCQDIDANANAAGGSCTLWGADDLLSIPDDPNPAFGNETPPVVQPSGRNFTMRNGDMTSATTPAVVSGTYAGDSETVITITFTVGSDPDACVTKSGDTTCSVVLWFGAHIALTDEWASGGATTVPGSPYHVALDAIDSAAIGQRDNQMQAGAIVQPPILHLRKVVINDDGGTATVADFTLTANGTGSNDLSGTSPVDSDDTLLADTWALSETGPAGYTASAWVCVGGTQSGSTITLVAGEEATCTITNTDDTPTLKLVKSVVNNDGGTAVANDWDLTATGTSRTFTELTPAAADATFRNVTAGVEYTLSETTVAGYSSTGIWSCTAGGTFTSPDKIIVPLGTAVTCTITNTDDTPTLKLVKSVVNDNGGDKTAADFKLYATAATPNAGRNFTSQTASPIFHSVYAGVGYVLSEDAVAGYTAGTWRCDAGSLVGDTITVPLGAAVTCTITNDDIAPTLHLRKVVVNDNGGTKTVADFTLTADGTGTNDLSGTSPVDSGATLQADTWALSETTVAGYSASAWVCVGGTQVGSNITVDIGGTATCTITNDDQPGTIIIQKLIKPTGSLTSFAFEATGPGATGTDYVDFSLTGGQQNSQTLNAGAYTVTELVPLGWVLTGIGGSTDPNTPYACTVTGSGGSTGVGDLTTQTATISLKNGDTVTCVFENTGQGVTRTQGFWATHPQLAEIAWFGGTAFGHTFPGVAGTAGIGDQLLCGRSIDTLGKLMGGFWSDVSKTTSGAKRSQLDQARMQLLQQLLAAELNASAFGTVPSVGSFAAWETAYCGTNLNAIKTAQQQAASFNTAGDSGAFTPGTSADSRTARAIANKVFWDVLP